MNYEKELPHSLEAESLFLGSILFEPSLIDEVYVDPEELFGQHSGDKRHELLLRFMLYLHENDRPIDFATIAEVAGKDLGKIGGISYLSNLASLVPGTSNFQLHQEIIRDNALKRNAIKTFTDLANDGFTISTSELISEAENAIQSISNNLNGVKAIPKMSEALANHKDVLIKRKESKGLTGTKTASEEMDKLTGGHQKGDYTIIAARPSMGKTAYMLNEAIIGQEHAIDAEIIGSAALIFSLEMKGDLLGERCLSILGNLESDKLRSGLMLEDDWRRYELAMKRLDHLPIYIDDTPGQTIQEIEAKIRFMKKLYPNLTVYIDYLQFIVPGKRFNQPHEATSFISKSLKRIGRKYDIPMVVLSAVGRDCEKRPNKRPIMSDLRDSGSIESDADNIIFLYRDDYYNKDSKKKNIVEVIVAKGRNVGTGTIEMLYRKSTSKFIGMPMQGEMQL